jgi:hypothetical protein
LALLNSKKDLPIVAIIVAGSDMLLANPFANDFNPTNALFNLFMPPNAFLVASASSSDLLATCAFKVLVITNISLFLVAFFP